MDKKVFRWWDFPSAFLLLAALETTAFRLRITEWNSNLVIVQTLTFLAVVLGIAVGYSTFRTWIVRLFGTVFTLFFIPLVLAMQMEYDTPEWLDRLNNLYARLYFSIADLIHSKPVTDPLLFLSVMALFFWLISFLAAYQLTRHGKPWGPLVISGLALLIIDFYAALSVNRNVYGAIFVFLFLVLIARLYLVRSRREWIEKGATVDPEIGANIGKTVAIFGLALVFVVWNLPISPSLSLGTDLQKSLALQWDIWREKLQNLTASLTSPATATSDFFGNSMVLGAGGPRDDEIVFTVKITGAIPTGIRFYWKAHSYDRFNSSWLSTIDSSKTVTSDQWPFLYPDWQGRKIIDLTFSASTDGIRNLYLPAFPLSIGHGADVIGQVGADGTFDLSGVLANPILRAGDTFDARSWVTAPTIFQLMNASVGVPQNIAALYLQLPADFSQRIRTLAQVITQGKSTQYDKVDAITNWLRKNITYENSVPPPPDGTDPIDWFLFSYKKGFCNYYATAEVLMLRSLGIPARIAVGYAEGGFKEETNTFTIRRRDSHAWPEVYFNGYGWVEFEPTAAQPETVFSGLISNDTVITPQITPGIQSDGSSGLPRSQDFTGLEPQASTANLSRWFLLVPLVLVVGVVAFLAWLQSRGQIKILKHPIPVLIENNIEKRGWVVPVWVKQWARQEEMTPIERMYARLGWTLPLLGHQTDTGHTPAERMNQLTKVLPDARLPLQAFLAEYQRAEYSPYPYDLDKARKANRAVWLTAVRVFFRRLRR